MPKKHGLGFGNGRIIEYEDGTAGYIPTGSLSQAFRVNISDVVGFSVTKGDKALERQLNVLGNGTLLGSASVPHGTAEKIEHWFRTHPRFGDRRGVTTAPATLSERVPNALIADELTKLAELRSQGVLTESEFTQAKSRLLNR